jgi:hypothetical protein
MVISYGLSVVLFIPMLIFFGATLPVQLAVILGHILCSLSLFRLSRSTFIGLDFYFDPVARTNDDEGEDSDPVPVQPRPRRPLGLRRAPLEPPSTARGSRRAARAKNAQR